MKQFIGKGSVLVILIVFILSGCAAMGPEGSQQRNKTGWGAGIGAMLGAGIGALTSDDKGKGALIGAAAGATLGGIAGNQVGAYMDRQQAELERVASESEALAIQREGEILRATFSSKFMFATNSAELQPGAQREVARVAQTLNEYDQTLIEVEGHTDSTGSAEYNEDLSQRRAETVKNALVDQGVDPRRISTIGYGEEMPISDNLAENRRVELLLMPIIKE